MRIRLKIRVKREPEVTFPSALPHTERRWGPMLGSIAAHAAVLTLLPVVVDQVSQYYADDFSWASYRAQTVTLRLPETLYYAPPAPTSSIKRQPKQQNGSTPERNADAGRVARAALPIPKGLELPATPAFGRDTAVLLQPDPLPKAELRPTKLPPLAFWARTDNQAPKPRHDEITPGTAEQSVTTPQLAAPPVRAVPNQEPTLADKNIASSAPAATASLPVTPSATAPVRDQSSDPRNGALDRTAGQSANVISLSTEPPMRPGEVVVVPAGSHGVGSHGNERASAGAGGNTAKEPAAPAATTSGRAVAREARPTGAAGSAQNSQDSQSLRNNSAGPVSAAQPSQKTLASNSSGNPAAAVRQPSPPPTSAGAEAFTRIMHPPNGTFDVVVTQSGAQAELPGAATHLTGSPVYSVYLRVGDAREWVLAFCLPVNQRRNSRYEVYIEDATPLDPPYPIKTTIPKAIASQSRSKALVFHGFLTAAGTFRDMEAADSDAAASQIASTLREWQFRPARKNNVPTDIQVALIIPATNDDHRPSPGVPGF